MARASNTPVPYWLGLPIREFFRWINSINEVEAEDEAERKRKGQQK